MTTEFPFPPDRVSSWAALSGDERGVWLGKARDRHFESMRSGSRPPDAPPHSRFAVDLELVRDLPAFFCALGEAINGPGGYFGGMNYLSLQDCLHGGFGVTLPFHLEVRRPIRANAMLDGQALANWASERIVRHQYLDSNGLAWLEQQRIAGMENRATLLDVILRELADYGVAVDVH
jgi:hypothetical protein